MRNNVIAIAIGLITSIIGGYVYSWLIEIKFPFVYALSVALITISILILLFVIRGKLFLLFVSGISGYFPYGQKQYIRSTVDDIVNSENITIIGARGKDLVGEGSPVGNALSNSNSIKKATIYLLAPESEYSRLRSEHLEVERLKYVAECHSVDNYIGVLALHNSCPITKYSYNSKPLFRIIITDRRIYLSVYQTGIRGRDLPCWVISTKSKVIPALLDMYCSFLKSVSVEQQYKNIIAEKEVKNA